MKRILVATSVALGCAATSALADPVNLQPGQWSYEITFTVPGANMNPVIESDSDCLGEWESKLEPTALAKEFAGGAECTASNVSQDSNRVTFNLDCPGQAMRSAKIVLTHNYSSFLMDGDVDLDVGEGRTMASKMKVDAKRTGACTS
ncbi:MAG: DUF3617 family protein [Pseudomonadota bacterium]